jgi:hypothetical protein
VPRRGANTLAEPRTRAPAKRLSMPAIDAARPLADLHRLHALGRFVASAKPAPDEQTLASSRLHRTAARGSVLKPLFNMHPDGH